MRECSLYAEQSFSRRTGEFGSGRSLASVDCQILPDDDLFLRRYRRRRQRYVERENVAFLCAVDDTLKTVATVNLFGDRPRGAVTVVRGICLFYSETAFFACATKQTSDRPDRCEVPSKSKSRNKEQT